MFDSLNTNVEVCKNKHEKLKITCGCLFGINLLHADYISMSVVNRFRLTKIKVFLEVSQNSQENTCARVSFLISYKP